jgi:hypothetical protein
MAGAAPEVGMLTSVSVVAGRAALAPKRAAAALQLQASRAGRRGDSAVVVKRLGVVRLSAQAKNASVPAWPADDAEVRKSAAGNRAQAA